MPEERIRPIAICVCRDDERILVTEFREKGRHYYRPIGGGIEFGERGAEAVQREFREEIGAELTDIRYVGLLENIYAVDGRRARQIVLVFDGRLSDSGLYDKEIITGDELGQPFQAVWKRLDEFQTSAGCPPGKPPVYPDGLIELLNS